MGLEDLLDIVAAACGERVGVGGKVDGLTYEDLARCAAGIATLIADSGCKHVAYVGLNGPAFPVAVFGSAVAGVPITPLNYRLSDAELHALVGRLDNPLVLADDAMRPRLKSPTDTVISTEGLLQSGRVAEPMAVSEADGERPAVVLFTSGTTSTPKAVMLRHSNLTAYVLQTMDLMAAGEEECALIAVPPYHIAGIASVLTNVYAARRMVHLPNFTPESWLSLVCEQGVTSAMVVPTMLARVVEHLDGAPANVPSLRTLAYGGARISQATLERALSAFPQVGFVNAYGLTETSSTIAVLGPEDHRAAFASDDPRIRDRLSSAGQAVPGIEILVRGEDGNAVPPGCAGEIFVRGPQVSGEYVGTGSSLDAEGWFPTRDRGLLDAEGYLFIEGRSDDTIIRGGENIAPAEIEEVLQRHPGVRDAAVVGLPDEEWGERIAAVLIATPGREPDVEEIRQFAAARLRSSKTPQLIEVWEELPYNALGKLLRREIVARLVGGKEPNSTS